MSRDTTNLKTAILDIAKALKTIFKKYSLNTRETAWRRISDKRGDVEVHKIIVNPNKDLNTFAKLVFKEWMELEEMIGEKQKIQKMEALKRAISSAIINLKHTAPEIFQFDNSGEPTKIKCELFELVLKLRDRGLIPPNIDRDRFAALVKTWVNRPVDDRLDFGFRAPSDEVIEPQDMDSWRMARAKYWGRKPLP